MDTKVASPGKAEDLSLGLTVKAPETGAVPVAKRTDINGRSGRPLQQRTGRKGQGELCGAMARRKRDTKIEIFADRQPKKSTAVLLRERWLGRFGLHWLNRDTAPNISV